MASESNSTPRYVSLEQAYTDCGHSRRFSAYAGQADRFPPTLEGLCPGCRNLAVNVFGCYSFDRNRSAWRVR